jgi:hypothetical protein
VIKETIGTKIDDAAEAALLAVYVFFLTIEPKLCTATGHLIRRVSAPIKFACREDLPLTPEQRRPIVQFYMQASSSGKRKAPPRKRKASAAIAPAAKRVKA